MPAPVSATATPHAARLPRRGSRGRCPPAGVKCSAFSIRLVSTRSIMPTSQETRGSSPRRVHGEGDSARSRACGASFSATSWASSAICSGSRRSSTCRASSFASSKSSSTSFWRLEALRRLIERKRCRSSAVELRVLQRHGLQVALEGGERAAQVVGDVADQVAAHALGQRELLHVRLDRGGHLVEAARQGRPARPCPAPPPCAPSSPRSKPRTASLRDFSRRVRRKKRESPTMSVASQREEERHEARAQVVAVADHAQGGVVALAAEDDVDVALLACPSAAARRRRARLRLALRGSSPRVSRVPVALDERAHRARGPPSRARSSPRGSGSRRGSSPARPGGRSPPWG